MVGIAPASRSRTRGKHMDTAAVIERFNAAFQTHDGSGLADLIAEDCVIENTGPAPDGARLVGREAALANWVGLAENTGIQFTVEEVIVAGDRAVIRWRLRDDGDGVRGVNVMRVRDGLIVEGLGYVKAP
jgi:ketosteroid isomerase-like protein